MKPFRIIRYQLYLLQLENYELGRYLKLLVKKGLLPKEGQRKQLVWTLKSAMVFVLALFLITLATLGVAYYLYISALENWAAVTVLFIFLFHLLQFVSFIFLTLAVLLLKPLDYFAKEIIISRARAKVKDKGSNIKIIGIAGSYGKTTMKAVLATVISEKFKVKSTPESVNTPVGISRWILNEMEDSTEILILEMGEHYRGDIKEISGIAKLDIAVVTGINESHLERMGKMETVIDTIFEIVGGTKPGAMIMLNGDDPHVMANYKKYVWPDHKVRQFQISNSRLQSPEASADGGQVKFQKFDTQQLAWVGEIGGLVTKVGLPGEYALGDVDAAVKIGRELGMADAEIKSGVEKIKPVEHRLQPIKSNGNILVIDDAYNGNPDGVREAIKVLSRFSDRRKVFVTPGLVETGKSSRDVHMQIGRQLATAADVVVLIKNSVTPWIEEGIKGQGPGIKDKKPLVYWFDTATQAHASLGQILKPNDVVVFQNDWGDQYL